MMIDSDLRCKKFSFWNACFVFVMRRRRRRGGLGGGWGGLYRCFSYSILLLPWEGVLWCLHWFMVCVNICAVEKAFGSGFICIFMIQVVRLFGLRCIGCGFIHSSWSSVTGPILLGIGVDTIAGTWFDRRLSRRFSGNAGGNLIGASQSILSMALLFLVRLVRQKLYHNQGGNGWIRKVPDCRGTCWDRLSASGMGLMQMEVLYIVCRQIQSCGYIFSLELKDIFDCRAHE